MSSRRVLAVRFEPAEAAPGEPVRAEALVADPGGATGPAPRWSWCEARAPLTELAPASPRCLLEGAWQRPLGDGARVEGAVPADACRRFGPDPPDGDQGADARPVDPDVTGGWSAPVRVALGEAAALAFARVRCNLAGVTREQFVAWTRRARPNRNPTLEALERVEGDGARDVPDEGALAVPAGAALTLRARWPSCAAEEPCAGAERYVAFDPVARELVVRREAMRVSWYATAGSFREPRTGRARDDEARASDNVYTAPPTGEARLWVVLRDERGGVAWRALRVTVR